MNTSYVGVHRNSATCPVFSIALCDLYHDKPMEWNLSNTMRCTVACGVHADVSCCMSYCRLSDGVHASGPIFARKKGPSVRPTVLFLISSEPSRKTDLSRGHIINFGWYAHVAGHEFVPEKYYAGLIPLITYKYPSYNDTMRPNRDRVQ